MFWYFWKKVKVHFRYFTFRPSTLMFSVSIVTTPGQQTQVVWRSYPTSFPMTLRSGTRLYKSLWSCQHMVLTASQGCIRWVLLWVMIKALSTSAVIDVTGLTCLVKNFNQLLYDCIRIHIFVSSCCWFDFIFKDFVFYQHLCNMHSPVWGQMK